MACQILHSLEKMVGLANLRRNFKKLLKEAGPVLLMIPIVYLLFFSASVYSSTQLGELEALRKAQTEREVDILERLIGRTTTHRPNFEPFIHWSVSENPAVHYYNDLCLGDHRGLKITHYGANNFTCSVEKKRLEAFGQSKAESLKYIGLPDVVADTVGIQSSYEFTNENAIIVHTSDLDLLLNFWTGFIYPLASILKDNLVEWKYPTLYFTEPPFGRRCLHSQDLRNVQTRWLEKVPGLLPVKLPEQDPYHWYTYHSAKLRMCFRQAVVADLSRMQYEIKPPMIMEIRKRMKNMVNVKDENCRDTNFVTLQANGHIKNLDELKVALSSNGYKVQVINFSALTTRQIGTAHCSRVLIGVRGDALSWATMQRDRAALLEIAWPMQGWPFKYSTDQMSYMYPKVKAYSLEPEEVTRHDGESCAGLQRKVPVKLMPLIVGDNRDFPTACKQLLSCIDMSAKSDSGTNYTIDLESFHHFIANSVSHPTVKEVSKLVERAVDRGHTRVETALMVRELVRHTKISSAVKPAVEMLSELRDLLLTAGENFYARVSVETFTKMMHKIFPLNSPTESGNQRSGNSQTKLQAANPSNTHVNH